MVRPDALFLLIKSLTKTEKRYFKLSISKYQPAGNKDYMRLFDAIEAQKVFDEKAIARKFKDEPYFKHLPSVKKYLHRQILKSLRNLYEEESCGIKLNNYLIEIEILFNKGLFTDCNEKIKKAKAIAEKHEEMSYLLKLIAWEENVATYISDLKKVAALKNTVIAEEKNAINRYVEVMEMKRLYLESHYKVQSEGEAKAHEELNLFDKMLVQPQMRKEAKTFHAEKLRLTLIYHSAMFKRDIEGAYPILKQLTGLFERQPHQINESPSAYLMALLNLVNVVMTISKFNEAQVLLPKIKNTCEQFGGKIFFKHKLRVKALEIDLLLNQGRMHEAAKLAPALVAFVETGPQELDLVEKTLLYNNIFSAYFGAKDYKNAQIYLQKIIHLSAHDVRMDMQYTARLTYLILQYEQKEYGHLSYVLRSTYRYLLKRNRVYKLETLVINFLKSAISFSSEKQMLNALARFKQSILPLLEEPFERNFMIAFPLIEWIDSKLLKKDLAEITREKYLKAVEKEELEKTAGVAV